MDDNAVGTNSEASNPAERSIQCVKSKGKWKIIKRQPTKSALKRRQYITDARRTYSQMLLNAFNSCDICTLAKIYNQYCTPDIITVSLYDGIQNPNGNNSTEMRSITSLLSLWTSLFKSAPDLLFQSEFLTAYSDPEAQVTVVKSKFRMTATRVVDVKMAMKVMEKEKDTTPKTKFTTTDESELMAQIHEQLASSYCGHGGPQATTSLESSSNDADMYLDEALLLKEFETQDLPVASATDVSGAAALSTASAVVSSDIGASAPPSKRRKKEDESGVVMVEKEVHCSIFKQGSAVVAEGATIYSDPTPLAQSTKLSYAGTFTVYLNAENKICRYEFVYTAD